MDWENKQGVFVAIERPGKSADGSMYSMRGECLDGEVEEFDSLLEWAKFRKLPTLAIGDGGNELGLGQYKKLIGKCVDQGERIAAQIAADLVLVAGTSNWGAHGICAGLKAGAKPEEEKKREADRLKKIVAAGAIDGATKRREESVDGYDRTAYLEQVGRIYGK
jgi:hypothetical protein